MPTPVTTHACISPAINPYLPSLVDCAGPGALSLSQDRKCPALPFPRLSLFLSFPCFHDSNIRYFCLVICFYFHALSRRSAGGAAARMWIRIGQVLRIRKNQESGRIPQKAFRPPRPCPSTVYLCTHFHVRNGWYAQVIGDVNGASGYAELHWVVDRSIEALWNDMGVDFSIAYETLQWHGCVECE